jgi:hypothetical protein
MARNRKRTEQAPVTIEELPRDTKELTPEEAEAAKGGWLSQYFNLTLSPQQQGAIENSLTPEQQAAIKA